MPIFPRPRRSYRDWPSFFKLFRTVIWYHQLKEFKRVIQEEAEMDEAYFGGKRTRGVPGKRGRGSSKQPVFGIFERNGRVYAEIIPNCKRRTLLPIIKGKVSPDTVVYTDKWRGYDGLVTVGYNKHKRINLRKENSLTGKAITLTGLRISGHLPKDGLPSLTV